MHVREGIYGLILSIIFAVSAQAFGLADCTPDDSAAEESRIEHLYGGSAGRCGDTCPSGICVCL